MKVIIFLVAMLYAFVVGTVMTDHYGMAGAIVSILNGFTLGYLMEMFLDRWDEV